MIKKITSAIVGTAMFVGLGQAAAQTLYAVDGAGGNPSTLFTLDPATGAVLSTIGPTGFDHVTGLAVHPISGLIYGLSSGPGGSAGTGTGQLLSIDPTTGAATPIGLVSDRRIPDMGFDSLGTLFAWCEVSCNGGGDDDLYTIDLITGLEALVGVSNFGTALTGLAFDAADNLFVKNADSLNSVDPTTGLSTGFVNISSSLTLHNALEFDPAGTLYTISRDGGNGPLLTIDPNAATATPVGNSGIANLSAIAFGPAVAATPVSEPATLALLSIGLAGLGFVRRQRSS